MISRIKKIEELYAWALTQQTDILLNYHRALRAKSTYQLDAAETELLRAVGRELDNRYWGVDDKGYQDC